ncbi:MAG: type III pantothenate kinase [Rhodanobacteraceae bacterium]
MKADNSTWLFDLGNSRLKGAWLCDRELAQRFALAWDAPDFDAVLQVQLARWPVPARVLVASVASGSRADRLRTALQTWPKMEMEWLRSPRQGCGITTYYRVPERLGIDRFLAMAAARSQANDASVIVAGCGTALTLDAVDAKGRQCEGLIAPSPDLMLRSLHGATAIADANRDAFAQTADDDTARALQAGCARAAAALVEWYRAKQRADLDDPPIFLHGGWAASLKAMLEENRHGPRACLLDDAVLRGLALWGAQRIPV